MEQRCHTKLRAIRKATGKKQKQVADELGVSKSVYSSWETGRHEMNVTQILVVSAYFGCTPNDILDCQNEESLFTVLSPQEDTMLRLWRNSTPRVRTSIANILRYTAPRS